MLKRNYVKETTVISALVGMGCHVPEIPYVNQPPTKNVWDLLPFDLIEGIPRPKSLEEQVRED